MHNYIENRTFTDGQFTATVTKNSQSQCSNSMKKIQILDLHLRVLQLLQHLLKKSLIARQHTLNSQDEYK